jgi:hypothetical protein
LMVRVRVTVVAACVAVTSFGVWTEFTVLTVRGSGHPRDVSLDRTYARASSAHDVGPIEDASGAQFYRKTSTVP